MPRVSLGLISILVFSTVATAVAAAPEARRFDAVVDVTGLSGREACAAMQGALNDVLGQARPSKRVFIHGSLGTREKPADFSMFHNAGGSGFAGKPWPYSVCHGFWPTWNAKAGEGIIDGYPDPLFPKSFGSSKATGKSTRSTVAWKDPICANFSIDRKLAVIVSGKGKGQVRWIAACDSKRVAKVQPDWDEAPDGSSEVEIIAHRTYGFGRMDLYVEYDLEVHYRNSKAQKKNQHAVFADMGLQCYFVGDGRPSKNPGGCPTMIMDGLHRSGRITVHEYGARDDGRECAPTWMAEETLTNRSHSIIWQAFGPGVVRGSDTVRLDVTGQGDRDNIGVIAVNTWTKDFVGWRVKKIGTGLWVAGSLNDSVYDAYLTANDFGMVVGSNEPWGAGFPRHKDCYTGICEPFKKDSVSINIRGGVIEGNTCGNVVLFGGYGGTVDRTFIETGAKGSPTYAGHSVIVGAGVCDEKSGKSERQGKDRRGMVCGDDLDCPGSCFVHPEAKRRFLFNWDPALVSNRGSDEWFAFMLGKGTQKRYLAQPASRADSIRVFGRGFGGEKGRLVEKPGGEKGGLYFYASEGASARIDGDEAVGSSRSDHLPPYDYYVSMATQDFAKTVPGAEAGRYHVGHFFRRATCTEAVVRLAGGKSPKVKWSLKYGPSRKRKEVELASGVARKNHPDNILKAADFANPFVPRNADLWIEVDGPSSPTDELVLDLRCYEDKW